MMNKVSVIQAIGNVNRSVFTTREIATLCWGSLSSTSQSLALLSEKGVVKKITRGIWVLPSHPNFTPFMVVPFLTPEQRVYVSFISALHLYGMIEQIPQVMYIATTGRGRIINTDVGTYSFHQLNPQLFRGFEWYGKRQDFLIASPEKALIDCLYISSRKGKRFGTFPELKIIPDFSFARAEEWVNLIPDKRIRGYVSVKWEEIKLEIPEARRRE